MKGRLCRLTRLADTLQELADRREKMSAYQVALAADAERRKRDFEATMRPRFPGWKWGDPNPGDADWPGYARARGFPTFLVTGPGLVDRYNRFDPEHDHIRKLSPCCPGFEGAAGEPDQAEVV